MKKIIRILTEAQRFDDSFILSAQKALAGAGEGAYERLSSLCRRKPEVEVVIAGYLICLHITKEWFKMTGEIPKHAKRDLAAEYQQHTNYIEFFAQKLPLVVFEGKTIPEILRPIVECRRSSGEKYLSRLKKEHPEVKEKFKVVLTLIAKTLIFKAKRTRSDACKLLANFLNSIGYRTLYGKRFTRENILKVVGEIENRHIMAGKEG
jgi:hypothetical protein